MHVQVRSVKAGQFCSFLLSDCSNLRSGMVLLDINEIPRATIEFECELTPIDKIIEPRIISNGYQPVVYTQTIKQSTRIINEAGEIEIQPLQCFILRLRFLYRPEYIEPGTRLMIKDTFITAIGRITNVFYIEN